MSFAKRLSIALEEESNLPIDASELDSGEASENLITDIASEDDSLSVLETDAEIQKDDESVTEAMEVVDEMSVNVDINEEALSDPSSVTEEQVEAAQECLKYNIVPFIIEDKIKMFYYRGLKEWKQEKGYLTDTCLSAQDTFKNYLDYFRIEYLKYPLSRSKFLLITSSKNILHRTTKRTGYLLCFHLFFLFHL